MHVLCQSVEPGEDSSMATCMYAFMTEERQLKLKMGSLKSSDDIQKIENGSPTVSVI